MNSLRKMLIKTITLLTLLLIAFDASKATALAGKYTYPKNTKAKYVLAPDFKLKDLNGKIVSLSSFRGKKTFTSIFGLCGARHAKRKCRI